MAVEKINITVQNENNEYVKLLKIIPYASGGFAVVLPKLLSSHIGRLEKTFVSYEKHGTKLNMKRDETEQYSANDIVKFSYHTDGFVQFSSTTNYHIKSGRNPDGMPKGLGVLSWPLSHPISTGASMSMTFWGLTDFTKEKLERVANRYVFETKRSVPHPKATFKDNDKNAYAMAFYIIPNAIVGREADIGGRKYANLALMQGLPDGKAFMRLREEVRIIRMPIQSFYIGISWFIVPNGFDPDSGYVFLGPTDGRRGLVASYHAVNYGEKLSMKDLTFK